MRAGDYQLISGYAHIPSLCTRQDAATTNDLWRHPRVSSSHLVEAPLYVKPGPVADAVRRHLVRQLCPPRRLIPPVLNMEDRYPSIQQLRQTTCGGTLVCQAGHLVEAPLYVKPGPVAALFADIWFASSVMATAHPPGILC